MLSFPNQDLKQDSVEFNTKNQDLDFLLHLTSINNVEFQFAKNLLSLRCFKLNHDEERKLGEILECCENNYKQYLETIKYITSFLSKKDIKYLVIKSYAPYSFVKDDVDILITERNKYLDVVEFLKRDNWHFSNQQESQIHFDQNSMIQIDLHKWIGWDKFGTSGIGVNLFDNNKLWKRHRKVNWEGIEINLPSVEDDILIIAAHSIFQHHYTTLNEIIHIGEIIKNASEINIKYIRDISDARGWWKAMESLLYYVQQEYKTLFNLELFNRDKVFLLPVKKSCWMEKNFTKFHSLSWISDLYLNIFSKQNFTLKCPLKMLINLVITFYRALKYYPAYKLPYNCCFLKQHNLCKIK